MFIKKANGSDSSFNIVPSNTSTAPLYNILYVSVSITKNSCINEPHGRIPTVIQSYISPDRHLSHCACLGVAVCIDRLAAGSYQ